MRLDKLTTKLQEALADAQSQAVGNDNQYIEPVHLLLALLNQDDGGTRSLLQRAGVNINGLLSGLKPTGQWSGCLLKLSQLQRTTAARTPMFR